MEHRILEICYDIAAIPGRDAELPTDTQLLRFRDGAVARIEDVLGEDGLGHVLRVVRDDGKLILRAVVMDFDAAEARLGAALAGTPWADPAEILRYWDSQAVA